MRILKKAGWLLVVMLPLLLSFIVQTAAMYGTLGVFALQATAQGVDKAALLDAALETYVKNPLLVALAYQLLGLLIFGLWYYFAYGREKRPKNAKKITWKTILLVLFAGLLFQIVIDTILFFTNAFSPAVMKEYSEQVAMPDQSESIWLSVFTAVVSAPILEEVLYRGLVFRLAEKVSKKFWVMNCIQALAFGILHLNLVQGIYAFFFGLVLGYLYSSYRNLWLCMLLHSSFNLASGCVDSLFAPFPKPFRPAAYLAFSVLSLALLVVFCRAMQRPSRIEETME